MSSYTLNQLAQQFDLQLRGDGDVEIHGVATLANAGSGRLSFLSNPRYVSQLADSGAAAVIISEEAAARFDGNALISGNVYASYARIATLFDNAPAPAPGIHPNASVADDVEIDSSVHVGAAAVIEEGCRIGPGVVIGAGSYVGHNCVIGAQTRLVANVTICHSVNIGSRVIIHPGVVIGADGFGMAMDQGSWLKVPQLGSVRIGDDCEIGANTTVDRGAIEDTVLEADVRLDNQVQIAHNVRIGAHTALAGCVGVAGSTSIGRNCMIAGASGISGHLTIVDNVMILAMTMVTQSIMEPGQYSSGIPAQPHRDWQKNLARIRSLDKLARSVQRIRKFIKGKDPNER